MAIWFDMKSNFTSDGVRFRWSQIWHRIASKTIERHVQLLGMTKQAVAVDGS